MRSFEQLESLVEFVSTRRCARQCSDHECYAYVETERDSSTVIATSSVFGKAFGTDALGLTYSAEISAQVKGLGKSRRTAAPKYSTPVDLRPLCMWLVERRPVWEKQTARARFQEKWSGALAALRNDRMTRSDDESKWDPRLLQYFRCYDNKGELVTGLSLPVSLVVVISTDGYVCRGR